MAKRTVNFSNKIGGTVIPKTGRAYVDIRPVYTFADGDDTSWAVSSRTTFTNGGGDRELEQGDPDEHVPYRFDFFFGSDQGDPKEDKYFTQIRRFPDDGLTTAINFNALEETQETESPEFGPTWAQQTLVARDETLVARDEVVAVEATNDGIMTAVAADSGSAFSQALSSTIGTAVDEADAARMTAKAIFALDPAVAGSGYTPAQRTAHIHSVISARAAFAGAAVIEVPGVQFVVGRSGTTVGASGIDMLFVLPKNTAVIGQPGSAIVLDPTTAPNPNGLIIFQAGNLDEDGSDVSFTSLTVRCNESVIAKNHRLVSKQLTSNIATLTTAEPHGYSVGDILDIVGTEVTTGSTSSAINGSRTVASIPSPTTFTVAITASNQALSTLTNAWATLAAAAAGSVWALGSRRLSSDISRVDRFYVRGCTIEDCRIAVSASKNTVLTDLGANQWSDWRVEGCNLTGCSNRMIELAQVSGGLISGNLFANVTTAVHLVSFTRGILMINNRGTVQDGGLRIGFGVTECDIVQNKFTYYDTAAPSTTGCLRFHSEPAPTVYVVSGIRFRGNYWGASPLGFPRSLTFHATTSQTNVDWLDITFDSDVFAGEIIFAPAANPAACEAHRITFSRGQMLRAIVTAANATYNVTDITFDACAVKYGTAMTVLANRFAFTNRTRFTATPSIGAGATDTIMEAIVPSTVTDSGTNSHVNNYVLP